MQLLSAPAPEREQSSDRGCKTWLGLGVGGVVDGGGLLEDAAAGAEENGGVYEGD